MALKVSGKFKFKGVQWRSGHVYRFRYSNWYEDPEPLIVLLYRITGIHPNTGHQWRLIQAINLNYVPRHVRKNFVINWKDAMEKNNGNTLLTWEYIKRRFPNIAKSDAIRRYQIKPTYMIQKVEYIPLDKMEDAVISSWHKDFSKKIKMAITRKFRKAQEKRRKRTDDKGIGKILRFIFGSRK